MKLNVWYENIIEGLDLDGEILPAGTAIMAIAEFKDRCGREYMVWIRDGESPIDGRVGHKIPDDGGLCFEEKEPLKTPVINIRYLKPKQPPSGGAQ